MKTLEIKAGSICIYKEYNLLKRAFCKLFRKSLPYNKYLIYYGDTVIFTEATEEPIGENERYVILEPVKPYSRKEKELLRETAYTYKLLRNKPNELVVVINLVRPDTVNLENFTISSLLQNKYYKVLYDSKGKTF